MVRGKFRCQHVAILCCYEQSNLEFEFWNALEMIEWTTLDRRVGCENDERIRSPDDLPQNYHTLEPNLEKEALERWRECRTQPIAIKSISTKYHI